MKKIKKFSVRLSQEHYEKLVNEYMWYKDNPVLTRLLYQQEIKTFSDYIRLTLKKEQKNK